MERYKILTERPGIDNSTAGKYMNFESVLTKYENAKRYRLIGKTVLITTLILIGIFTVFYLTQQQKQFLKKSSVPGIINQKDSSNVNQDKKKHNPDAIPFDSTSIKLPADTLNSRAVLNQKVKNKDTFKIKETLPAQQQYIPARPTYGYDSLYEYFNEKLRYPENLMPEKITGKVILRFSIYKDGKVGKVTVIQKLNPVLDSIAMVSVINMPPWTPARANGINIETTHSIPLIFSIDSLHHEEDIN
jgi:TonB family protein